MRILLTHNLKHAATVKILLSGLSFWEEGKERLWDGNNQDISEWERLSKVYPASPAFSPNPKCVLLSALEDPSAGRGGRTGNSVGMSLTLLHFCTNPLEGKPESKKQQAEPCILVDQDI